MRSRWMLTSPVVVQVTQEAAEGNDGSVDERRGGCGGAAFRRESRVHDGGRALCRALRHGFRRVVSRHNAATGGGLRCTGCSVRTNVATTGRGANGDHVVVRPGRPAETPRRGHLAAVRRASDVGEGRWRWRCVVIWLVRVVGRVGLADVAFRGDERSAMLAALAARNRASKSRTTRSSSGRGPPAGRGYRVF